MCGLYVEQLRGRQHDAQSIPTIPLLITLSHFYTCPGEKAISVTLYNVENPVEAAATHPLAIAL